MIVNERQIKFGWGVAAGLTQTAAYMAAYGCDEENARANCHVPMDVHGMEELIAERRETLARVAGLDENYVLKIWMDQVEADPRELIELKVIPCKFCWDIPNADDFKLLGYDLRRDCNPSCRVCDGEGTEKVVAKDQRRLSRKAARLLAGVKVTQNGLEIKMHDQSAAAKNLADYLGMMKTRSEISGPGGGPLEVERKLKAEDLTDDELAAAFARLSAAKG